MFTIESAYEWALLSLTTFSVSLDLFILWLIYFRSPKIMHEYRFYLFGTVSSDLLFSFVLGFVIQPDPWIPFSLGTAVKGLARYLDWNFTASFSFSLAVLTLTSQLMFQMFSMVFRFVIVMDQRFPNLKERILLRSTKVGILCNIIVVAFLFAGISFTAFFDRENLFYKLLSMPNAANIDNEFDSYNQSIPWLNKTVYMEFVLDKNLLSAELLDPNISATLEYNIRLMDNLPEKKLVLQAYRNRVPIIFPNLGTAVPILVTICLIISGFFCLQIICILLGVAIIRFLRTNTNQYNQHNYRLHMQLIVLLIIQMVEPIVLIAIPVFYACYGLIPVVLGVQWPFPGLSNQGMKFGILLLSLYPAFNSLLTIGFIPSYRESALRFLGIAKLRKWIRAIRGDQNHVAPNAGNMYPPNINNLSKAHENED